MSRVCTRVLQIFSLAAFTGASYAALLTGTDESARLPFWEWQDETVSIRLVQRLPDQSRAFFTARQFSPSDAERIAQSCVFQTVFKNIAAPGSGTVIRYDLTQWEITPFPANSTDAEKPGTDKKRLKVKEQWLAQWERSAAPQRARIAFAWALLPTEQKYQAGDYNWGMTTYDMPPGQRFDLRLVWYVNEQRHSAEIPNLQCAADEQIGPPEGIAG